VLLGYKQEIIIALSGCFANLLLAALAFAVSSAGFYPEFFRAICFFSLLVLCFNLLPAGPLDGGRALEAFLCARIEYARAQTIINVLSAVVIVPLAAAGYWLVASTGFNISLMLAAGYLAFMLVFKDKLISGGR
jgi:stage IV sporulation protein FB